MSGQTEVLEYTAYGIRRDTGEVMSMGQGDEALKAAQRVTAQHGGTVVGRDVRIVKTITDWTQVVDPS